MDDGNWDMDNSTVHSCGYDWGEGDYTNAASCLKMRPNNADIHNCCTGKVNDANTCTLDYCPSSAPCKPHMDTYCKTGLNLINDPDCVYLQDANAAKISLLCSDQKNFRSENCKKFCNSQTSKEPPGPYNTQCQNAATEFCKANPRDPACVCINYNTTPDYKAYVSTAKDMGKVNWQCWQPLCTNSGASWSDNLKNYNNLPPCPTQLTICDQSVSYDHVNFASVSKVAQDCSGATTIKTNPDGTKTTSTTTPAASTTTPAASKDTPAPAASTTTPAASKDTPAPKPKSYTFIYIIIAIILFLLSFFSFLMTGTAGVVAFI